MELLLLKHGGFLRGDVGRHISSCEVMLCLSLELSALPSSDAELLGAYKTCELTRSLLSVVLWQQKVD